MKATTRTSLSAFAILLASAMPFGAPLADGDHPMAEGTVRKIDTEQGKVTIKHGPIANLEMPPMTMVFRMRDPSQLDGLAKGDKVKFHVVDDGGKMVIETLESAQ